jgi:hypothetical protein
MSSVVKILCVSFMFLMLGCYCVPSYFPGIYYSNVPSLTPPAPGGRETYISIDLNLRDVYNCGYKESNSLIRVYYSKADGGSWWGGNYGLFGYIGSYNVRAVSTDVGAKEYFGFGAHGSFNLFIVPLRFIKIGAGVYAGAVTVEFGEYPKFIKERWEGRALRIPFFPLLAIYPLVQFNLSKEDKISLQALFGSPGGLSTNLSYYREKFGIWISAGDYLLNQKGISAGISIKID